MVHIIVIAHSEIANSFVSCVEHILSKRVDGLHILAVRKTEDTDSMLKRAHELISKLEEGAVEGILILSDLYGATPCNIAQKLIKKGKIELIAGLNMPMLIRAISYAKNDLATVVAKALEGVAAGVIYKNGDNNG